MASACLATSFAFGTLISPWYGYIFDKYWNLSYCFLSLTVAMVLVSLTVSFIIPAKSNLDSKYIERKTLSYFKYVIMDKGVASGIFSAMYSKCVTIICLMSYTEFIEGKFGVGLDEASFYFGLISIMAVFLTMFVVLLTKCIHPPGLILAISIGTLQSTGLFLFVFSDKVPLVFLGGTLICMAGVVNDPLNQEDFIGISKESGRMTDKFMLVDVTTNINQTAEIVCFAVAPIIYTILVEFFGNVEGYLGIIGCGSIMIGTSHFLIRIVWREYEKKRSQHPVEMVPLMEIKP